MVLFCDVVGFTSMSKEVEASEVRTGAHRGLPYSQGRCSSRPQEYGTS